MPPQIKQSFVELLREIAICPVNVGGAEMFAAKAEIPSSAQMAWRPNDHRIKFLSP